MTPPGARDIDDDEHRWRPSTRRVYDWCRGTLCGWNGMASLCVYDPNAVWAHHLNGVLLHHFYSTYVPMCRARSTSRTYLDMCIYDNFMYFSRSLKRTLCTSPATGEGVGGLECGVYETIRCRSYFSIRVVLCVAGQQFAARLYDEPSVGMLRFEHKCAPVRNMLCECVCVSVCVSAVRKRDG